MMASSRLFLAAAFNRQCPRLCFGVRETAPAYGRGRLFSDQPSQPSYSDEYFSKLVTGKPLVLFMKGEPSSPMCGFSRLVVQILHMHGMERYDHYDVLSDVDFKEGMKKFSNWPTFPQVYMKGELVGGADIMLQMHQSGDLVTELSKIGHKSALLDKNDEPGSS